MRELITDYLLLSGLVATVTAPWWVPELTPGLDWRLRVISLVWLWAMALPLFAFHGLRGLVLGLVDAWRGRG